MMYENKCNYCKKNKKLCDAHLYPKALREDLKGDSTDYTLIAIKDKDEPKKGHKPVNYMQTLPFDKNILCSVCDNELGFYDDELLKTLRTYNDHPKRKGSFNEWGQEIETIEIKTNTEIFQLGVLTSLWRLSISKRISISLGDKYNGLIRAWLKNKKIPDNEKYLCDIILLGCYDNTGIQEAITTPLCRKLDFHSYIFMIKNLVFMVNVGNKKLKSPPEHTASKIDLDSVKVLKFTDKIKISLFPPDILLETNRYFIEKNNNSMHLKNLIDREIGKRQKN